MLEVLGHRVMIKPDPPKKQFQDKVPEALKNVGFEVAMSGEQEKRELVGTQIGTIIGIGPMAWKAYDGKEPDWKPWAKVGDRVMFARYAGKITEDPETEELFLVLDDVDVQVKVTGEKNPFEE